MLSILTLCFATALGPPPEPAYLNNARVRALWEWSQAAWIELNKPVSTLPTQVRMVFELEEWRGRESTYLVTFSSPDQPADTSLPVVYTAVQYSQWFAASTTEWALDGAPRVSGDGVLGWFAPGNWLEYSLPESRVFSHALVRMSNPRAGARIRVGVTEADVPMTGSWTAPAQIRVEGPFSGVVRLEGIHASDQYWIGDLFEIEFVP